MPTVPGTYAQGLVHTSLASLIQAQRRVPGPSPQPCRCPTTLLYLPHWKLSTTSLEICAHVGGHQPPGLRTPLRGSGTPSAACVSQANPKLLPHSHALEPPSSSAGPRSSPDEMTASSSQHKEPRGSTQRGLGLALEREICVPGFWSWLCRLGEALVSHLTSQNAKGTGSPSTLSHRVALSRG